MPARASSAAVKSARASSRTAQPDSRDAALVEQKRAFVRAERFRCQQLVKRAIARARTRGGRAPAARKQIEVRPETRTLHVHDRRRHALSRALRAVRRPFDRGPRGGERDRRAYATTICSTSSPPASGPTTRPSAAVPGMVLRIEPIARALDRIAAEAPADERRAIVVPSPSGERFTQDGRGALGRPRPAHHRLRPLRGHRRPARAALRRRGAVARRFRADRRRDSRARLHGCDGSPAAPGRCGRSPWRANRSRAGLLDYPSFTRPATFRGVDVPPVLLSGDHAKIAQWRREQSRLRTAARRRDLLDDTALQGSGSPVIAYGGFRRAPRPAIPVLALRLAPSTRFVRSG